MTRTLLHAFLDPTKALPQHYGAIKGLAAFGPSVVLSAFLLLSSKKDFYIWINWLFFEVVKMAVFVLKILIITSRSPFHNKKDIFTIKFLCDPRRNYRKEKIGN